MKDDRSDSKLLDAAIDAIKADSPTAAEITEAGNRARAALEQHRGPQAINAEHTESIVPEVTTGSWDSIDDYIAAIPAYLAGELSPQQATLFEEESRQSIPLRRALNAAREQQDTVADASPENKGSKKFSYRLFAVAATITAVAVALFAITPDLPSFNQNQLAQIDEIDGELYQIVDGQLESLTPGTWIDGRQRIRSANGSKAVITLDDGSQIEVDERSELSMTRRSSGNRIDVSRGRILVVASPQGSGTLDVFTDEFMVSVTGTIFEVAHGAKGSRVAVIEGSVDVLMQGNTSSLESGEVLGTRQERYALNLVDELAWSKDADEYIAMIQEVVALQQDLQAVIDSPNRFSSRLLDLAPADTAMYVAVPNAPEKIVEIYDVIRDRLENSDAFAEAWAEFNDVNEEQHLDEIMTWMREIGYTLGDETVFTISVHDNDGGEVNEENLVPVVLSEVDADVFRASFENTMEQVQARLAAEGLDTELEFAIVDDPADAIDDQLSILLVDDIMVASNSGSVLQEMQNIVLNGGSDFVDGEFHEMLQYSYSQGTEIIGALDLQLLLSLTETNAPEENAEDVAEIMDVTGLANAQYLIGQYSQEDGMTSMTADMYFDGERTGLASWLSYPGPMGSLEFFSTDTTFVSAALIREPSEILAEFEPLELPDDFDAHAELELFYNVIGVLGGEVAFGLDGPALPSPAWKIVIEAYDAASLQDSIEWSVNRFNEVVAEEDNIDAEIVLTPADVAGYTGYEVALTVNSVSTEDADFSLDSADFNYAFVDGYLIAAADEALIDRAISYYESGAGLHTDSELQELMAMDGYLDFSAIMFSRVGELLGDLMGNLPTGVTAEQEAALAQLDVDVGPSFSSALALSDRIHLSHNGSSQLSLQFVSQLAVLAPLIESAAEQIGDDSNNNSVEGSLEE